MKVCEEVFRVLDLWLWLYDRLGAPGVFRGRAHVLAERQRVAELIDAALRHMGGLAAIDGGDGDDDDVDDVAVDISH
jgi:hypothetical protein